MSLVISSYQMKPLGLLDMVRVPVLLDRAEFVEQQIEIALQMSDAVGGDRGPAFRLRKNEGALQDRLGMQGQRARGGAFHAVEFHCLGDVGFECARMTE